LSLLYLLLIAFFFC